MNNKPNKFKLHQNVKTVCAIYVGLQKDQFVNLTKMEPGAIGQIQGIEFDFDMLIWYYVVRFPVISLDGNKKYYWAKLNEGVLTEYHG